jgi:GNAT superfamily N-acetyltransferase
VPKVISSRCSAFLLHPGDGATELLKAIGFFLAASDRLYPGIDRWWQVKAVPGLATGERRCLVALWDGNVVGAAIAKVSRNSAKLCSVRVDDALRGLGVGEYLVVNALATLAEAGCARVHYTISEEPYTHYGAFFSRYGFSLLAWQHGRYVRGCDELFFGASVDDVLRSTAFRSGYASALQAVPEGMSNERWSSQSGRDREANSRRPGQRRVDRRSA